MNYKTQKFLVAGMSRSGESCTRFLLARGAQVYMYDDVMTDSVRATMQTLAALGAKIVTAEQYAATVDECDILVLSPGIPIDNALPVAFRKQGKAILGEEELGAMILRANCVAVTGTNGKTTTVSMIEHALKTAGHNAVACGNIGNPLIREAENLTFDDYAVVEISSFQLETLSLLRPHVAVITNVTEDHLNRHYNMENYIFLKGKILRGLRESEYAVLNYDDERVRAMAQITKAKVVYFSATHRVEGAYLEDGVIYFNGKRYLATKELAIEGLHNVYNALACVAVCGVLRLESEQVSAALKSFKGIRHRLEFVKKINGVSFINDSKATNVDAALKAVNSMRTPTVLLLGGKDKGYHYAQLFDALKHSPIRHAVLYGENRFQLMNAAVKSDFSAFSICEGFETAVKLSFIIAKDGQTVLLSPASASFDSFANYEERGEAFVKLVEDLYEQAVGE